MSYEVTEAERLSGVMAAGKLAAIAEDVAVTGYAVVGGLIPMDVCELLMTSVLEDAEQVRAAGRKTPHEEATGEGHLQLGLRRYAPYVRAELVANPLIESVVAAVLGPRAWLGFYSGNVNLPGSVHQPLHYDRPFSWRTREKAEKDGQSWPPPTTTLHARAQWSRPAVPLIRGVRANSPIQMMAVSSNKPRCSKSSNNALMALSSSGNLVSESV